MLGALAFSHLVIPVENYYTNNTFMPNTYQEYLLIGEGNMEEKKEGKEFLVLMIGIRIEFRTKMKILSIIRVETRGHI
jgi:hypothetical protein